MSINIQKAKSMPIQQTRLIKPVNRSMPIKLKSKSKSKINELIKHMTIQDEQQTELESIKQFIENVKDYYIFEINNTYFIKSCLFFYYFNKITNFKLLNNGNLNKTTANCSFIITTINETDYFVKFVNYNTIFMKPIDLLFIDNINGYIFTEIINKLEYTMTYKYSFLSYCKDNKWNFKQLHDDYDNKRNIESYKSSEEIKNYVCLYLAINGKSLDVIFDNEEEETIDLILNNCCDFVDFLINIGYEYGFTHNDLHFSNLMFDYTTNTIKIIDYGRVIFYKYLDEENTKINDFCKTEIYKLNLDNDLNRLITFRTKGDIKEGKIQTYKELFLKKYNLIQYYDIYIQEDFNIKSLGYLKYPYILFDLVTFYFHMYLTLYVYFYSFKLFESFKENFGKIIKIENENIEDIKKNTFNYSISIEYYDNYNILFETYKEINENYIKVNIDILEDDRKTFKYLLDGLILIVLLLIHHNKSRKTTIFNIQSLLNVVRPNLVVHYPIENKIKFFEWLKTILETNNHIIIENNHHIFINLISKTTITGGGHISTRIRSRKIRSTRIKHNNDIKQIEKNYISMYKNKSKLD